MELRAYFTASSFILLLHLKPLINIKNCWVWVILVVCICGFFIGLHNWYVIVITGDEKNKNFQFKASAMLLGSVSIAESVYSLRNRHTVGVQLCLWIDWLHSFHSWCWTPCSYFWNLSSITLLTQILPLHSASNFSQVTQSMGMSYRVLLCWWRRYFLETYSIKILNALGLVRFAVDWYCCSESADLQMFS